MKRIINTSLIIILIIILSGCQKKEPSKIELNEENFNDYIILDVDVTDFEKDTKMGLVTRYEYQGVANLKATARLRKDVNIENVIIKGKITTTGMCWSLKEYEFTLELDKNGEANYSKQITTGEYGLLIPDKPSLSQFYFYELKDGEFFLNDNKIVITSINGNVYE